MALLRIRLFGEPDFRVDAKPHVFQAPPRTLPLLAYLLLHRESHLNRETIANLLWPDVNEEEARANLRRHLHYTKRALPEFGDPWFEVTKNTISWNAQAPYWLDVAEFEASSKSAKRREQAAALYRGDLFERCDDEWIVYDRERLHNAQIANLAALASAAKETLQLERGIEYAMKLLALDPWREDTVRMLMELRAANGDRAGALSEFDRLCERLRRELDVDPMPETRDLYERLKTSRTGTEQQTVTHAAIVGRETEIEALERCWRNALNGHTDIALVGGEAGSGKTTLVAWLCDLARKSGNVFTGAASPDRGSAFGEFADILRACRPLWDDRISPVSRALVARLLPEIGEGAPRQSDDEAVEQVRLFTAIADALEAAAQRAPLLLCLEDLHWAGETTVLLVEHLARRLQRRRVLIAGTYREEEVPITHPLRAFRRRFARSPFLTHIVLGNLAENDVLTLADRALGADAATRILPALFEQSDGNPLMVRELLLSYGSGGELAPGENVRALIGARIAALHEGTKIVAQGAAILGSAVDLELVADLTGLPQRRVIDAVNDLCARHIFRAGSGTAPAAFAHQLFADAAYESAAPEWRKQAHARAAVLLEAYYGDDPAGNAATLAFHAERGSMRDVACRWYFTAARRAFDTYANSEAAAFAERGLALADSAADRVAALLLAEDVAKRAGESRRRRALLDEIEKLDVADPGQRAEVLLRELELAADTNDAAAYDGILAQLEKFAPAQPYWQAQIHWCKGIQAQRLMQNDRAVVELKKALKIFEAERDKAGELRARLRLFEIALHQGYDPEGALEQVRSTVGPSEDPGIRARLLLAETRLLVQRDNVQARTKARELAQAAELIGDRRLQGLGILYEGAACASIGVIEDARRLLAQARDLLAACGSMEDRVRAMLWEGIAELNVRNVTAGLEVSKKALALAREWSLHELAFHLTNNIGIALKNLGDPDGAREMFLQALELSERQELAGFRGRPLSNLGYLAYAHGDYAAAATYLTQLLETAERIADEDVLGVWGCLGVCFAHLGEFERARDLAKRCLALIEAGELSGFQQEGQYFVCALLFRLLGDADRARDIARIAYATLQKREALLPDEKAVELFNQEEDYAKIRAAVERDEWPEDTLAAATAP